MTASESHDWPRDCRAVLRLETREAHEALHRDPGFAALVDGTLSSGGYDALMDRLHRFYAATDAAMEAACRRFRGETGGYDYLARGPLLARDLKRGRAGDAPKAIRTPALGSPAALAGAAYVLEGALLGGATLERAARRLPFRPDNIAFWTWCREQAPPGWRKAATLIAALDRGPAERREMIESAAAMFRCFGEAVAVPRREPAP